VEHNRKLVCDLLNGDIFSDLNGDLFYLARPGLKRSAVVAIDVETGTREMKICKS